ncbi:pyrimidine 5-nucleotidase [Wallemia mellicola CBS 633.66]|uniref:Pyrimidine 5-nucleotidase n=2 Tax=Wallemia mellicola TaxID=1708541 RepID=I4YDB1_WALMC|nr:pyrimidine 5-nucleotidase [Wallemia mellicola CBS 633.66]EIM21953.1 pyrimidine 5-nucleotidase [Wallemia mellicola CBS 633.66]TIB98685.1 pyrimidine 5-nucleotidase [Wallemia mellicola]TIC34234.1 pyrimidine 5-nucleotidase [Wallemia mellicola]|eukprot:XP_006957765.1 pyrimidine 5-nucleotidase [Wallemia mellicola CBS 633.66]
MKSVIWFDIDNCLYGRSARINEMMSEKIANYFLKLGLSEEEADKLHREYYIRYGLAIRGLVENHKVDPLDYDYHCDASLPLEEVLKPDLNLRKLLQDINRDEYRVWALTNAYKTHAYRVLNLLGLEDQFENVIYCDYTRHNFPCKPEKEFYVEAMEKVGLLDQPERNYFIDDSSANVKTAKEMGWNAVYYLEYNQQSIEGQDDETKRRFLHHDLQPVVGDLQELRQVWKEVFK